MRENPTCWTHHCEASSQSLTMLLGFLELLTSMEHLCSYLQGLSGKVLPSYFIEGHEGSESILPRSLGW